MTFGVNNLIVRKYFGVVRKLSLTFSKFSRIDESQNNPLSCLDYYGSDRIGQR